MERLTLPRIAAAVFSLLLTTGVWGATVSVDLHPNAAPETMQFARLVGEWKITDYSLDQNGEWQQGPGADWNWYLILNGFAVQDDWISPPLADPEPEAGRQFGTNIRIYNPAENRWDLAWASNNGQQVDTFVAVADGDDVVMTGIFGGRPSRITFFDITDTTFDWRLEFQNPEDETWAEVYRIHGDRKM